MSQGRSRLTVWGFIKGVFKAVVGFSLLIQSLLFIALLIVVLGLLSGVSSQLSGKGDGPSIAVPEGGALVLNPSGTLVEATPPADPFAALNLSPFGGEAETLVSVHDLVRAVRAAKDDDRIKALVLDLGGLYVPPIFASKAHYLADEIEAFREAGKSVVAIGDYYTQEQYLLASEADTILMHDLGNVTITGYGRYRTFYKEGLDKLKVTGHVFRVGTFKSAIEPYIRDDMSPAAKEANLAFLSTLWDAYAGRIDENRDLQSGGLKNYAENTVSIMNAANGDAAQAAVNAGIVDRLASRHGQTEFIAGIVGREDGEASGFKGIGYSTYLISVPDTTDREDIGNVAVITGSGGIVDGEAPVGMIGGDTLSALIREARLDGDVKAIVLRVDSGGGSAFASEVIRDEVLLAKDANKPVVVSMGSLAASGGYWISANANEIWAAPTTVTGSIGVFGFFPTFENTLAEIGINTDGVGTTPLSAVANAGAGPLPPEFGELIQASIEDIYRKFIGMVADARGMSTTRVDEIGQGRVWIGETAQTLGLVDKLGDIDDAIAAAASLAGLDDYDVVGIRDDKTPFEMFLEQLAGAEAQAVLDQPIEDQLFGGTSSPVISTERLIEFAKKEAAFFESFNDPNHAYLKCSVCSPE